MIKCSSCGIDIDILQLADHVCAKPPPSTAGKDVKDGYDLPQAHMADYP